MRLTQLGAASLSGLEPTLFGGQAFGGKCAPSCRSDLIRTGASAAAASVKSRTVAGSSAAGWSSARRRVFPTTLAAPAMGRPRFG